MKMKINNLVIASLFCFALASCSGGSDASDAEAQVEEMETIEADAQKTMEEIESETEELEQDIDSLLREI